MSETFRNRNFSLLWFAGLISLMGNWMLIVAVPFHVYTVTGSALAASAWLMASILPGVLFGSVAGVFVDRWDRRKTMIGISLLQALTILLLLFVRSPETIWIVYIVGFVESTLGQFFSPAESALLPTLVGEEHLVSANSLNVLNDSLARILGSAFGGMLLGVFGLGSVVIADAASYLGAALLIALIAAPSVVRTASESEAAVNALAAWTKFWSEWRAALQLILAEHNLRGIFSVIGVALFGDAILSALLVVWAQGDVGLNATEFGWLLTARGIGGVAGGLLVARFGPRFTNRQLTSGGLILSGALIVVLVAMPTLPVLLVGIAVIALPAMAWIVAAQTILQQSTADEYRGRIFGTFETTASFLMLLGAGFAGLSADWLGATLLVQGAALIYVVAGLMAGVLLRQPEPALVQSTAD